MNRPRDFYHFSYQIQSLGNVVINISLMVFVALLQRQGLNVKGLLKAAPAEEEPQAHIDCTGNLQVT